jgi:hypothetical protein
MEDLITLPESTIKNQINVSFSKNNSEIPFTIGTLFRPNEEVIIAFFN